MCVPLTSYEPVRRSYRITSRLRETNGTADREPSDFYPRREWQLIECTSIVIFCSLANKLELGKQRESMMYDVQSWLKVRGISVNSDINRRAENLNNYEIKFYSARSLLIRLDLIRYSLSLFLFFLFFKCLMLGVTFSFTSQYDEPYRRYSRRH